MAAFALITSLLNTIEFHFQQPLPCLILDDTEMVESLCKKIRYLQAFLEDCEKNNINSQARRALETEIRGVAHDAEAKIESQLLHQLYLPCNQQVEHPLKLPQSLYQTLQQITQEIESIKRRVQIESNNNQPLEPQRRNAAIENIKAGSFSESCSELKNVVMVGCDDEYHTIMQKLISHSKKEKEIIPIVGMGGIGKTTLVRRVYEDELIISHFDIRAWTIVSQLHDFREMLLGLLSSIGSVSTVNTIGVDNSYFASQLRKKLKGQRYLIVIDDIWSCEAWDWIRRSFPEDFNGSRILLTTRLRQVADYASPGGNNNSHVMRFLNSEESWDLFCKKVFGEKRFPLKFERDSRAIVEKCQGLPLTIIVVAGLLTSINKSLQTPWRNLAKNLNLLLTMDPEEKCSKILSLSYKHLPPHLKVCFLYLGVFPEGRKIPVKKLIRLWIAEGLLKLELNKTMEQVAETYLQDLIDRGLVQIDSWGSKGKIKSCRLHALLHSFCIREAQNENLLYVINKDNVGVVGVHKWHGNKSIAMSTGLDAKTTCPWISNQLNHFHWPIARAWYENHTSLEFHSILYFPKEVGHSAEPFPCFKLLRVLDIASRVVLNVLPSEIVDLVNLRYLAITTDAFFQNFQCVKLQSLQTFIVHFHRVSLASSSPPPEILDMPRLRHVHFSRGFSLYLPNLVQHNLQTISWLNLPHHIQTKPDLKNIPNVKELGIYIETCPVLECVVLPPGSLDGLADLLQLENLKIAVHEKRNRPGGGFQLPTVFPPNLKKLTLDHTYLPWDNMAIIATLHTLEVLKLIGWAFCGPEWKTTENGFCKLKHLQIVLSDLKHWIVVSDHFPALERLVLSICSFLDQLPAAFADVTTLQLIELSYCHSSLITSAKQIQDEQQDYGNDKLIVRDFRTRKLL